MKFILGLLLIIVNVQVFSLENKENEIIDAVLNSHLKTVNSLLNAGVNVNVQSIQNKTLLYIATERNDVAMVDLLLNKGALIDYPFDQKDKTKAQTVINLIDPTPFLYAAAHGQAEILSRLIQQKPNLQIRNYYGGNALIPAAEKGHYDTAKILLEKTDIDVDFVNHLGWTALLEVVILSKNLQMQLKMAKLLLDHGANIFITDGDGVNALDHAKRLNRHALILLLQAYL